MTEPHDLSVSLIYGIKDWGLERLRLSLKSARESLGELHHEIIVVDYGSTDPEFIEQLSRIDNVQLIRIDTDGTWSRSRALNAGLRHATGSVWMTTDADMLFSPRALEIVARATRNAPETAFFIQCRDLPSSLELTDEENNVHDWNLYNQISTLRPRWGMGGLVAAKSDLFMQVNGLDERMHTYGGEDLDFAKRIRGSGHPIQWIDHPNVRMFHIWHPSSGKIAVSSQAGTKAVSSNQEILSNDPTFIRNLKLPSGPRVLSNTPLLTDIKIVENFSDFTTNFWSIVSEDDTVIQTQLLVRNDCDAVDEELNRLGDLAPRNLTIVNSTGLSQQESLAAALKNVTTPWVSFSDSSMRQVAGRFITQLAAMLPGEVGNMCLIAQQDARGHILVEELGEATTMVANAEAVLRRFNSLVMRTDIAKQVAFNIVPGLDTRIDFVWRLMSSGAEIGQLALPLGLKFEDSFSDEKILEKQESLLARVRPSNSDITKASPLVPPKYRKATVPEEQSLTQNYSGTRSDDIESGTLLVVKNDNWDKIDATVRDQLSKIATSVKYRSANPHQGEFKVIDFFAKDNWSTYVSDRLTRLGLAEQHSANQLQVRPNDEGMSLARATQIALLEMSGYQVATAKGAAVVCFEDRNAIPEGLVDLTDHWIAERGNSQQAIACLTIESARPDFSELLSEVLDATPTTVLFRNTEISTLDPISVLNDIYGLEPRQ